MVEIIVGEKVINLQGEIGTIVSYDNDYIFVQYKTRVGKLPLNVFEEGFLKYQRAELQSKVSEGLQRAKLESENKRRESDKAKEECRKMEAQAPVGVRFNSVSKRFEPAPASFSSVKNKHRNLVEEIFSECDKDIPSYYELFHPEMRYIAPAYIQNTDSTYLRSRYSVGFVTKYLSTFVIRVFSRNDVYKPGKMGGCTVTNCDITEILRILRADNETYFFSKHLSRANGSYKNTTSYGKWQASQYSNLVNLDEVICRCDVGYLNDCVNEKNVNCFDYSKLLMAALHNNKAEIVFKNKQYSSVTYIDNIEKHLEDYTSKQVDFACKNNVISSLPIIKDLGLYDVDILKKVDPLMQKTGKESSIYDDIVQIFIQNNFDTSNINKKIVSFVKREEGVIFVVYRDYIKELLEAPNVTVDDVFDTDYCERHMNMQLEKRVHYSSKEAIRYKEIAQELSWIDREYNGYYVVVPKTISEFKCEGQAQHNCVYTCMYFRKVINRSSIIIFLRKEKEEPFVTIELDYYSFEIKQALGKYNRRIDAELYSNIENLTKELYFETISRE